MIARSHHEKWNGAGYPDGLPGDTIPFVARLVAVVDVFDALVSARPYKGPWSGLDAAAEIRKGVGIHFDPTIASAFLELFNRGDLADLILAAIDPDDEKKELTLSGV